jgi:lipopolysaccharide transport system ATP-binding protein
MRDNGAISLSGVGKVYKLYPSRVALALDTFGLYRLKPGGATFPEHQALRDIDLEIGRGERVGIIGRNGAGKTTLLRIVSGIAAPTAGRVNVQGRIQALLDTGLGFHPDFTGIDNIKASLLFNGLDDEQAEDAIADISAFAELGEHLHQPLRTYSQGMRARLGFACATAVRPDILIVDEVLGAGDAYFSAKSAHRMEQLTASGCTLLLVSHSVQQVLQFCQQAVWIEAGRIVMRGHALAVVKAYEEFIQRLEWEALRADPRQSVLEDAALRDRILSRVLGLATDGPPPAEGLLQSAGGVSRWAGEGGLRIADVALTGGSGEPFKGVVRSGEPLGITITVEAEATGSYPCIFALVIFTEDGRVLARHVGGERTVELQAGERHSVTLFYDRTLLGNGVYFFSAAVYRELDLQRLAAARFYDLLSRSFKFRVASEFPDDPSVFHPPALWR